MTCLFCFLPFSVNVIALSSLAHSDQSNQLLWIKYSYDETSFSVIVHLKRLWHSNLFRTSHFSPFMYTFTSSPGHSPPKCRWSADWASTSVWGSLRPDEGTGNHAGPPYPSSANHNHNCHKGIPHSYPSATLAQTRLELRTCLLQTQRHTVGNRVT